MNIELTKIELIEMLIGTQKIDVLKKIKAILEEEKAQLTEEEYEIITSRKERHLNGESKSFSWKEAREQIKKS